MLLGVITLLEEVFSIQVLQKELMMVLGMLVLLVLMFVVRFVLAKVLLGVIKMKTIVLRDMKSMEAGMKMKY